MSSFLSLSLFLFSLTSQTLTPRRHRANCQLQLQQADKLKKGKCELLSSLGHLKKQIMKIEMKQQQQQQHNATSSINNDADTENVSESSPLSDRNSLQQQQQQQLRIFLVLHFSFVPSTNEKWSWFTLMNGHVLIR